MLCIADLGFVFLCSIRSLPAWIPDDLLIGLVTHDVLFSH